MLKQPTAATGTGVAAPQSTAAASAAAASSGGAGSGGAGDPQQQTIAPEALLAELGSSRRTTLKRKGVAKVAAGGGTASKAAVQQAVYEVSEKDYLEFTPLGSGNEVGRSCHILKFKGKTIMLDCGIHPAYTGIAALPYFDEVDPSEIDIILISHFHLDHAASLPYFLEKDYVKVSTISVEDTLYDENDLQRSMDKIEVVNYHQIVHHKGIKFWCYNAGHVLGAAMFFIEIAGVKILYTGDYSRREDRHLMAAETPEQRPDILIIEATYGVQTLPPLKAREKRFTDLVHQIVKRGGRCLIPVFALGRAQELLLILDEYWEANPALQSVPIYYASALAKKCMTVYQTYINMMNRRIQLQSQVSNPFVFKHVLNLKGMDQFSDDGPSVVMASPGMLQNGLSRELFELWCSEKKNGTVIPGYCVEGTLAKHIMAEPTHITTMTGAKVPLHASVHYVSFSAHADFSETSEFIDIMKPPHVILVHGEQQEMSRLKQALLRNYGTTIQILSPKNCQTVELEFRAQKIAKAVGRIATVRPNDGEIVSGLIVRKDFNYHFMMTEDLNKFTPLISSTVNQKMTVPFTQSWKCLVHFVSQMYDLTEEESKPNLPSAATNSAAAAGSGGSGGSGGTGSGGDVVMKDEKSNDTGSSGSGVALKSESADEKMTPAATASSAAAAAAAAAPAPASAITSAPHFDIPPNTPHIIIHSSVLVVRSASTHVLVEWRSNPVSDMLADSLLALLMSLQANPPPGFAQAMGSDGHHHTHSHGSGDVASAAGTDSKAGAGVSAAATEHSTPAAAASATDNQSGDKKSSGGSGSGGSAASAAVEDESLTAATETLYAPKPSLAAIVSDVQWFLGHQFGEVTLDPLSSHLLTLTMNSVSATVDVATMNVVCSDEVVRGRVERALARITATLLPLKSHSALDASTNLVPVEAD